MKDAPGLKLGTIQYIAKKLEKEKKRKKKEKKKQRLLFETIDFAFESEWETVITKYFTV